MSREGLVNAKLPKLENFHHTFSSNCFRIKWKPGGCYVVHNDCFETVPVFWITNSRSLKSFEFETGWIETKVCIDRSTHSELVLGILCFFSHKYECVCQYGFVVQYHTEFLWVTAIIFASRIFSFFFLTGTCKNRKLDHTWICNTTHFWMRQALWCVSSSRTEWSEIDRENDLKSRYETVWQFAVENIRT